MPNVKIKNNKKYSKDINGYSKKANGWNLFVFSVALIGMFLPWYSATISGYSDSLNAFYGRFFSPFSIILPICFGIAIVLSLCSLGSEKKSMKTFVGVASLLCALVAIPSSGLCFGLVNDISSYSSYGSTGFGLFLTLIGSIAGLVTSICILATKPLSSKK